jgi:hypothetical protein
MIDCTKFLDSRGGISFQKTRKITDEERTFIEQSTSFLKNSPTISIRIKAILFGCVTHNLCSCGNALPFSKYSEKMFISSCSLKCAAKNSNREQKLERFKKTLSEKSKSFIPSPILSHANVKKIILNNKNIINRQYDITRLFANNPGLKESVYYYTPEIKKEGVKVRSFIFDHFCKICGSECTFKSSKIGFSEYCPSHSRLSGICAASRRKNKIERVSDDLKLFNYNIISAPDGINSGKFLLKCDKDHEFGSVLNNGKSLNEEFLKRLCPICHPSTISRPELEIKEWIESFDILVTQQIIVEKYKNGAKTIDLLIPSANLGIEYNGNMYHSYGKHESSKFNNHDKEDRNRHLNKTKLCEEQGIQLLHIFSTEWEEKKDIWKSMILSKLGLTKRIYARKCVIEELTNDESRVFLENNHIQGNINSKVKYGLFYEDVLVAVSSFGKARYSRADYELLRFATTLNVTVVGGFQKLLKHFLKHNECGSLVSYANRRWSLGNVYKTGNFELINVSKPNYFYFKDKGELESRLKFQKHKLDRSLGSTESEIMFNSGYRRIWDCGNLVYKYTNNEPERTYD